MIKSLGMGESQSSHLTVPVSPSLVRSSLPRLRHVGEPECGLSPKTQGLGN